MQQELPPTKDKHIPDVLRMLGTSPAKSASANKYNEKSLSLTDWSIHDTALLSKVQFM